MRRRASTTLLALAPILRSPPARTRTWASPAPSPGGQDAATPPPTASGLYDADGADYFESGNLACDGLVCIVSPAAPGTEYASTELGRRLLLEALHLERRLLRGRDRARLPADGARPRVPRAARRPHAAALPRRRPVLELLRGPEVTRAAAPPPSPSMALSCASKAGKEPAGERAARRRRDGRRRPPRRRRRARAHRRRARPRPHAPRVAPRGPRDALPLRRDGRAPVLDEEHPASRST